MPVDPRTGQNLPYPGEPGYEEAVQANPDAYLEMAGEMPPGGEPMPPGGAPTPDDITALEEEEAMLDQEIMAQAAPQPEKPFSVDAIQTLLSEFNNVLDVFAGEDIPDIEWTGSEGGGKWDEPLPPEVFTPLVALNDTLEILEDGSYADKYRIELEALTSDAELRKATASLKKMAKDKKLVEAMQAPAVMPDAASAEMPPAPGTFDQDEQMLAANMG
tara:strand:- start:54 stop:704 length:651 start_codon:yes stop_codon:yes gene_type:complete